MVAEHIASDMCVQHSESPNRLSMVTMIRSEKDNSDTCMMDCKCVKSLAALSMAHVIDVKQITEDIGV
jgi:hypothetical protein